MDIFLTFLIVIVLCVIIAWLSVYVLRKRAMKTITLKQRFDKVVKELEGEGE